MLQVIIFGFDEKIKAYLDDFAAKESNVEFKTKYETSGKTIKGCCDYITGKVRELISAAGVRQSGCTQIEDEVVYQMAISYFMEDAIVEKKPTPPTTKKETKTTEKTEKKKATDKFKKKKETDNDKAEPIKSLKLAKNKQETEKAKQTQTLIQLDLFS